jgi:hypothetical protein
MNTEIHRPSTGPRSLAGKINFGLPAILLACFTFACSGQAGDDRREWRTREPELPSPICDTVNAPESSRVTAHVYALGVQIYQWNGSSWVFAGPEAVLYADPCHMAEVGIHYAGPTWEDSKGRKVLAVSQASCKPAPGAIPWLLLEVLSAPDQGRFGRATHIQRVNTIGGTAPAEPGTFIGEEARVPYSAEYYFYRSEQ